MKNIYTLVCLFIFISAQSQITFNKRLDFDRNTSSVLTSVEVTDSCYYVCGLLVDTLPPHKAGSLFGKIDLEGNVSWYKALVDSIRTYETWPNTMTKIDNAFYATGYTFGPEGMAALLIKYNSFGDTIFTKKYQSPYAPTEFFMALTTSIVSSDHGLILLSNVTSPQSTTDISAIKTNSTGGKEWEKIYGGQIWTEGSKSICRKNGKYIIGAWQTNHNFVNIDYVMRTYIFQIDSMGNVEWEYLSPEGELQYSAADVLPTSDNGYIIASGKGTEHVSGQAAIVTWQNYVYKINADWEFEWGINLGSPDGSSNYLSKIVEVSNGTGWVVAGKYHDPTEGVAGQDNFGIISKISMEGNSLWTRYYQYIDSEQDRHNFYDLEETPDGGFIMVGEARDVLTSAEPPSQQAWIVKVDQYGCLVPGCHLIDEVEEPFVEMQLSLYPNPSSDYLNVFYYHPNHTGEVHFRLFDLQGKLLRSFTSPMNNITHMIPVSSYPAGQYFLQAEVKGKVVTKAFVVGR